MYIRSVILLLPFGLFNLHRVAQAQEAAAVGQDVCITGYIVDKFCIDLGHFLDNNSIKTLEHPEEHSYHCLLDPPPCIESGYQVLLDPQDGGLYTPGAKLNAAGNAMFLELARSLGDPDQGCTTCTGTAGSNTKGFRATVIATLEDLGSSTAPPQISVSSMVTDPNLLGCPDNVANIAELTFPSDEPVTVEVGQDICIAGWTVDRFCINLGHFLDNSSLQTLENPEEHSYHCMLDVPQCIASGYEVLLPPDQAGGLHTPGARLDAAGNEMLLDVARSYGDQNAGCTTCTGTNAKNTNGFRATFIGKVVNLGNADVPPTISVSSVKEDSNALGCPLTGDTVDLAMVARDGLGLVAPEPVMVEVGEKVCINGYIVDRFCINLGHFLDNNSLQTLEHPEEHSYHCMLDVPQCIASGYEVLLFPEAGGDLYTPGAKLDTAGNEMLLDVARSYGDRNAGCTTCTGTNAKNTNGFRATVIGTIEDFGNADVPPTISVDSIEPNSLECPMTVVDLSMAARDGLGLASSDVGDDLPSDGGFTSIQLRADIDFKFQLVRTKGMDVDAISVILTYQGSAWIAWAVSQDGSMIGSEAVVGRPDEGQVGKYDLAAQTNSGVTLMADSAQTLIDASIVQENGQTILTFTKLLNEADELAIDGGGTNTFLYAIGSNNDFPSYHGGGRGPFEANLALGAVQEVPTAQKDYTNIYIAHGIMMVIAWAFLTPMAVAAAFVRSLFPDATWFKIHMFFNATSFILTLAAFIVILITGLRFNDRHFITGWVIMGLVTVQVIGGALRPHVEEGNHGTVERLKAGSKRIFWEFFHKGLGFFTFALALWQMHTGLGLLANFTNKSYVTAYWGWIIAFFIVVALLKICALCKRNQAKSNAEEMEADSGIA